MRKSPFIKHLLKMWKIVPKKLLLKVLLLRVVVQSFFSYIQKLFEKEVKVFIMTRNPKEHEHEMKEHSEQVIRQLERIGVQVYLCAGNQHRKLAILDRKVL